MWTEYPINENYQKDCHLKNIGRSDLIIDVQILRHRCTCEGHTMDKE